MSAAKQKKAFSCLLMIFIHMIGAFIATQWDTYKYWEPWPPPRRRIDAPERLSYMTNNEVVDISLVLGNRKFQEWALHVVIVQRKPIATDWLDREICPVSRPT